MKFIFIADLHLSRYGQDKIEDTSQLPERLYSITTTFNNVIEHCRENDIKTVVIGGDCLHGKSVIYALAQGILLDFFRDNKDIDFIVIDGNHDLSGKGNLSVSALKSIDNEPNVQRINESYFYDDNNDILYVPYSYDMIDVIKKQKAKYLISHFGLNEGVLNSGISIVADISLANLTGKYDIVLLGHYHKPQEIINDNIELYYVGSLIQLDWGEKNEVKRFLVVDTDLNTIQSIPSIGYKKYIEYKITNENKQEIIKQATKEKEQGNDVKIIKEEVIDTDDIPGDIRIVDRIEKDITNRGLTNEMSEADKFKRYLIIKGIPEDQHQRYLDVANRIVEKCSV